MSQGFITRGSLSVCGGLCLLSTVATQAWAVEDGTIFHDVLLGAGSSGRVKVSEEAHDAAGNSTTYDWQGVKKTGLQFSLTSLNGVGYSWGGWVWGGELVYDQYNITPSSFNVAGVNYKNGSDRTLHSRSLGVNVLGGYEYGINPHDRLSGFVEVLPLLGGGVNWAESEVRDLSGTYGKGKDMGFYYQYGLRLGAYLVERTWIAGVTIQYTGGSSKVDIDFPGGYASKLTLDRNGLGFGVSVGHRF